MLDDHFDTRKRVFDSLKTGDTVQNCNGESTLPALFALLALFDSLSDRCLFVIAPQTSLVSVSSNPKAMLILMLLFLLRLQAVTFIDF